MIRLILTLLTAVFLMVRGAQAQDMAYVQIEAQPSLTSAEDRARDYASYLRDVNGFALGAGWYGIALGPYLRPEAEARLRELRALGQIPRDSFIALPGDFQRQFWPVGVALLRAPDPSVPSQGVTPEPAPAIIAEPAPVDETPREAAASEARLLRNEREALQIALQWGGFYDSSIDGAFGRGTRNSMAAWQTANGYVVTGILTTKQRQELLRQYNAVLEGMNLQQVTEARAGIQIDLPLGVVAFEKYESPFVHFESTTDLGARVLLISQPGDQTTLFGLYEIMQTLEIVPLEGPRERRREGFTLTGSNSRIVSHTEARLRDGAIKGFTLIWPVGDEERRTRVLRAMQDSFTTSTVVLDPGSMSDDTPSIDLLAGLQIRKPRLTGSGFYIDAAGTVVTSAETVASCGRITLDDRYDASVVARDDVLGVAVLRPDAALAPQSLAAFRSDQPRLQSEIAVSGYSFGGALTAPTLTFGTLEDLRGLDGDTSLKRLAMATLPGDAGGPVLDSGGAVLGMLLPRQNGARQLPDDVSFAVKSADIQSVLVKAGLSARDTSGDAIMAPEDLTAVAVGMTVLVSCWD
ncbi:serine protease [Puniceibacterium sp. IMCC21224]|uniref:serine protease n=1 Tax=Puniceibacterium sp. IMCC21224 TaxID=1618204 RepID=UPI00064D97A6|nr:serine protease [Puniceibacterium sp. IMCC21224]KMK66903.1 putative peptidoglycan binding protein [Puniceibacterium sp. IMCC21224]